MSVRNSVNDFQYFAEKADSRFREIWLLNACYCGWRLQVQFRIALFMSSNLMKQDSFIAKLSFLFVYSLLSLPQPSTRSLQHIYQTRLGRFFNSADFAADVRSCSPRLVSGAIELYRRVLVTLRPTPFKIHYTFSVRDLSQVGYMFPQVEFSVQIPR